MRSRFHLRSSFITFVGIAAVVYLFVVTRPELGPFSVEGGGPSGLKGMAILLEDLGYGVEVWKEPLAELPAEPGDDGPRLLIVSLARTPIDARDLAHLSSSAESGHTVLVFGGMVSSTHQYGFSVTYAYTPRPGSVEAVDFLAPVKDLELADPPVRFRMGANARARALVSDDGGTIVAMVEQGAGRLIFVSDSRLHTNRQLAKAQNLDVLLITLQAAQVDTVIVAEHAVPLSTSGMEIGDMPWRRGALGSLYAAVLVTLWAVGRRFGPPRPLREEETAPSMADYVHGVAQLYQRGGARRAVLQVLYDEFLTMVKGQLGGAFGNEHPHEQAAQLARRRGADAEALRHCLRQCEAALQSELSDDELIALATELEEFRSRLARTLF